MKKCSKKSCDTCRNTSFLNIEYTLILNEKMIKILLNVPKQSSYELHFIKLKIKFFRVFILKLTI
jgi:hypothetical protein